MNVFTFLSKLDTPFSFIKKNNSLMDRRIPIMRLNKSSNLLDLSIYLLLVLVLKNYIFTRGDMLKFIDLQ